METPKNKKERGRVSEFDIAASLYCLAVLFVHRQGEIEDLLNLILVTDDVTRIEALVGRQNHKSVFIAKRPVCLAGFDGDADINKQVVSADFF